MLAGLDGCRAGWIAVTWQKNRYSFTLYPQFQNFLEDNPDLTRALIDIPIGLSSPGYPRTVESVLRKHLPGRGSTVFNVPCRAAVYETDFDKAREFNIMTEGKSLSVQSLNICSKIREVDKLLPLEDGSVLLESHPELGFKSLNGGEVVLTRKNTPQGIEERLSLLEKADPGAAEAYRSIQGKFKRKDAKPDDLLDALCLCVINRLAGESGLSYVEDQHSRDEKDIPIRIAMLAL